MYWQNLTYIMLLVVMFGAMVGMGLAYLWLLRSIEKMETQRNRRLRETQKIKDEINKRKEFYSLERLGKEFEARNTKSNLEIKKIATDENGNFLGACGRVVRSE